MKKSILKKLNFCIFATFCLLTSCQSTKNEQLQTSNVTPITQSEVISEKTTIEEDEVLDCSSEDQPVSSLPIIDIQEQTNSKLLFSGNTEKFVLANEVSLFNHDSLGKLKERIGTITAYPDKNLVGFGSKYLAGYYLIFLDKNTGDSFSNAVNAYLRDFDNKKLERKNNKSYKKYGSEKATIYWGQRKTSTPNNGKGKILFGYSFVNKSPYFTITCFSVDNEYIKDFSNADPQSKKVTYYFTKAQAKELSSYLTNRSIENILYQIKNESIINSDNSADNY